MKSIIKILKIVFIVILSIILILNISIMVQSKIKPNAVPNIFGYKPFIVTSGSMESKFNVGDLVFVKNTNFDDLKVNDIIAFRDSNDTVITHRIIEEITIDNNKCFKTKGDNNNTIDEDNVCRDQLEGKYAFKWAKIGSILLFIQKPLGFIVMMLSLLIICLLIFFIPKIKKNKMDEDELKEFEEFKKAKLEKNKKK